MRKFVLLLLVAFCLGTAANVGWAAPVPLSLGGWAEGAPRSTQEYWSFTPAYVEASGSGYTADPEIVFSPQPTRVNATILGGTWGGDPINGYNFTGSAISVDLEIPNYEGGQVKYIWVDLGYSGTLLGPAVSAVTSSGGNGFSVELLPGQGDADFGIQITPNPDTEKISFVLMGTTAPAVLDYIHVDTMCPEPVTFVLLGLGACSAAKKVRDKK